MESIEISLHMARFTNIFIAISQTITCSANHNHQFVHEVRDFSSGKNDSKRQCSRGDELGGQVDGRGQDCGPSF